MTNSSTTDNNSSTHNHISNCKQIDYNQYSQQLLASWPGNELYIANLKAIQPGNPSLAQRLSNLQPPENAQLTVARDGSVTYKIIQNDGRVQWLGCSSMPMVSARANCQRTTIKSGNLAMNGIGHGQDARELLDKINSSQSLFIIEPDIHNIVMALHLRDFTDEFTRGKLLLLCGDNPVKLIVEFFADHPGYNIIDQALRCTWLNNKENQLFNHTVSAAISTVVQKNAQKIDRLLASQSNLPSTEETLKLISDNKLSELRVVNFTNSYSRADYTISRNILAAMAQLGITTDHLVLNRPDIVSPIAQLERFAKIRPHIVLLVDRLRRDFPVSPPESCIYITILSSSAADFLENNKDFTGIDSHEWIFAHTQFDCKELIKAGADADRVIQLGVAANDIIFRPEELNTDDIKRYSSDVAYIGSRYSSDPEKYNIMLPTIQDLWCAIAAEIRKKPAGYATQNARNYIKKARLRSVNIHDEELLDTLEELTQNYLGPTSLTDTYLRGMVEAAIDLKIWSWAELGSDVSDDVVAYWDESPVKDKVAGTIDCGTELNKLFNACKIYIYITADGRIEQYLLDGMAAGAFFLVRAHPDDRKPGHIGDKFKLSKELVTFDSPCDLIKKVKFYLNNEQLRKQIAKAGQKKVLSQHTYRHKVRRIFSVLTA